MISIRRTGDGFRSGLFRKIIIFIFHLTPVGNGQRQINWGAYPIKEVIHQLAYNFYYYFIRVFEYVPVGIFGGALCVFGLLCCFIAVKKRSIRTVVLGLLIMISLFALPILQGSYMTYRTAWTIIVFVPFVGYLLVDQLEILWVGGHKTLKQIIVFLLFYLSLQQAVYLHYILALNNQRSDNEIAIARQIGYRLLSEFERKEVIFVGEIDLGNWINSQIVADEKSLGGSIEQAFRKKYTPGVSNYKFTDSVVDSVLNWGKWTGTGEGQTHLKKYFSYLGYNILIDETLTREKLDECETLAAEKGMRPLEIRDMGDYILVNFG